MKKTSLFVFLAFLAQLSFAQLSEASLAMASPVATICGLQSGRLSPEKIVAEGRISSLDESMQVTGFTMTVYNERGIESYSSNSDQLTAQMIKSLMNTNDGQAVKFTQVQLTSRDKTKIIRSKEAITILITK